MKPRKKLVGSNGPSLDYVVAFSVKISWVELNFYNPVCDLKEDLRAVPRYMEAFLLVKQSKVC